MFLEYKHMIQCVDNFVLDLLTLRQKAEYTKFVRVYQFIFSKQI